MSAMNSVEPREIRCRRLVGRVAVITGATGGIGRATAVRLAHEGATVVVSGRDVAKGEAIAQEVDGHFIAAEATSSQDTSLLFRQTYERFGSIDICFNNAGISPPEDDSILITELDAWQVVQDVNLTAVYLACREVLPYMLAQKRGSIINNASFVSVMGAAISQISYTASKAGVVAMSRELGVQFARQGVRVNAVSPGPIITPMLTELYARDPERAKDRLVHIPLGRFGEAEEIASAVAFLASDDSSFITASNFLVDGGITGAYVTPA